MIQLKKFSIIDILIVLVVAGAVAFVGMKLVTSGANKGEKKLVNYTVQLQEVEKGRYDNIKIGDVVSINEKNANTTAVVKNVTKTPAEVMTYNSNTGEYKLIEHPDKENILVDLETTVIENEIGMKNSDVAIKVGMDAVVRGTGYSGAGFIIRIND